MKRERKIVDERQQAILALVQERKKVLVDQLSEEFQASAMTIRRDLQQLEEQGFVKRFYGGAELMESASSDKNEEITVCRRALARYAASLIEDGDTVFINGSSTALMVAEELGEKKVKVITNNARCRECHAGKNVTFILTGGELSQNGHVLIGDFAMNNLLHAKADKAFLGFAGISKYGDVICDVTLEIGAHQIMMNHSDQFYILLDHQKIGNVTEGPICSLEPGGVLITDQRSDQAVLDRLTKLGITVKVV